MPIPAQRDADQTRTSLAAWLARAVGADGAVQLGELRGPGATGFSNETVIVDAAWTCRGTPQQASYVVRVAPTGYSLFPDAAFDTQYRVLRALSGTSIPVPTVRWYETDASVLGAPFFVMDEVPGRVPPDNPPYHMAGWLFDVSPEHRRRLWWGAIDAMADLHRMDWKAQGLGFLTGGLDEGLAYYEAFLDSVEHDEPVPMARRALSWLRGHRPGDQPLVMTWGDARIGNVMYDDEGQVLAVLDWEMVGLGAPAQDVAWALFLDRHHSEGCDVPRLEGFPSTEETVAHYEQRSGIRLHDLEFYEVFSAFRFCVIMGRLAVIFKDWGLLPAEDAMAQDNTVTRLTERVLAEQGRLMLSPLDDLPVHQVAETMATVGTSDRNFYDRYYFSLHGSTDEFFLAAGLGQYPNLDVCDGFVCVAHAATQTVVRASRPLGLDRLDTSVGPLRVEVLEGLRRVRLVCEEVDGFALDVTWQAAIPAYEEPRMLLASPHGRVVIDTMRFLQTGRWTGSLVLDGRSVDVTPDRFWGSRDRSWGVRPVGEPEPAGAPAQVSGFFWNYFVAQFDDFSVVYMAQEDGHGRRTTEEGVRLFADGRVEHLGRPEHALEFVPGTRRVERATVRFAAGVELVGEVLRPLHLARGTGYGFDPDWRHGMWQEDETVVQRRDFDTTDPSIVPMPGAIIDNVARFSFDGAVGYGLLEVMSIGPHPQYFDGWD